MRFLLIPATLLSFLNLPLISAPDGVKKTEAKKAANFDYRKAIAPPIAAMPEPKFWKGVGQLNLTVSSKDPIVQGHVRQGFALLHAQWDVEAYRHFAAALKIDPDCLLAYTGVVMSMLNPKHEWNKYKNVALKRMLDLVEHKSKKPGDVKETFTYPEIERGYAISVITLVTQPFAAGAKAFNQMAIKYPNDIQLSLLDPYLNRGKFDMFGNPDLAQDEALAKIKKVLDANPENPLALNFYIMMLIEAPGKAVNQKKDVGPYVDRLIAVAKAKNSELPCWSMIKGYNAYRQGDLETAKTFYKKAAAQYRAWKKESKAGMSECDGLFRAYSFLAVIYSELGDSKNVKAMMEKLKFAKSARKSSMVYNIYQWHYRMMPAKFLFAKGDKASVKAAIRALPKINKKPEDEVYNKMIKAYQAYGLAYSYQLSGKKKDSLKMAALLGKVVEELKGLAKDAANKAFYPHYLLNLKSLMVHHNELAAMREEKGGFGAVNWYKEAIDLQLGHSRYFPPGIFYPMEYKLARYYAFKKDYELAISTYKKAILRMPSFQPSYKGLERTTAVLAKIKADAKKAVEKALENEDPK